MFLVLGFDLGFFGVFSISCCAFGCHYQCSCLPGKSGLQNDLLCVEWDVKRTAVCVVLCLDVDDDLLCDLTAEFSADF